MIHSTLTTLIIAASTGSVEWSPKVAIIMIICNVIAIAFGKYTMKSPSEGPGLPMPEMFGGMSFPALLATTSLGHIIGIGAILGLASNGVL